MQILKIFLFLLFHVSEVFLSRGTERPIQIKGCVIPRSLFKSVAGSNPGAWKFFKFLQFFVLIFKWRKIQIMLMAVLGKSCGNRVHLADVPCSSKLISNSALALFDNTERDTDFGLI